MQSKFIDNFNIFYLNKYISDIDSNLSKGNIVSKTEFLNKKNNNNNENNFSNKINNNYNNCKTLDSEKTQTIKDNYLYFDKTRKDMLRYPKGFFAFSQE
jgi:hypothetical protein